MNRRQFSILSLGLLGFLVPGATAHAANLQHTWIFVDDMHCAHCAKKITRKLYTVPGVQNVQTHLQKHFAVVTPETGKRVSPRAVWEAIEAIDFTPVKLQGPDGVFTAKP